MRVVVPWDRVALGLELPVLPGKLKTISWMRCISVAKAAIV
jgi:hypothetical protein